MKIPQVSSVIPRKLFAFALVILFTSTAAIVHAQELAAKRGFQAGGSFALSDIESINTTNGNLMMHMPLGSLPAGRGGLTAGINLLYSSKLYNSHTSWFADHGKSCLMGEGDPAPQICPYYQRDDLQVSDDGGWRYGLAYSLEVVDRFMESSMDPNMKCSIGGAPSDGYLPMNYRFKLKLHFPDGSVHEMRPYGSYTDLSDDPLGDYYNIRADGWIENCLSGGTWSTAGVLSYYSTDGTYLRLDIQQASHDGYWNDPWTLYMPDGSRVTGGPAPQRIYDRNSNYVEITNIDRNTSQPKTQLKDQLNRTITLVRNGAGAGEDTITSQGFGDTLVWKVRWKGIGVDKSYWPCADDGSICQINDTNQAGGPASFQRTLGVVDRITLPAQAGSLTYTFSYNAPDRTGGDYVPSTGWGELSGVILPSGAKAAYQYYFDNDSAPEFTPAIMKDFPTAKQLVYRAEYDLGNGSPSNLPCNPQSESNCITENWMYDTADNNGFGSVTGPDGGVSTDYAVPTNYAVGWQYSNVGLVYKSVRPDGTMTERIWAPNNLANYGGSWSRADNPYVKTEFTSIKSGTAYVKTAIKDYSYDKNGNITQVKEYDWVDYSSVPRTQGYPTGLPAGAVPTRVTTTGYYNSTSDADQLAGSCVSSNVYWCASEITLKRAAAWSEVSNNSTMLSRSVLTYDNESTTGNVTQQTSWDSTKGAITNPLTSSNSVSVVNQYGTWSGGATGKLVQTTDGNANVSRFTYGDIGNGTSDLYVTRSVTGDNSDSTSAIKRTTDHVYDFGTGAATSVTDVDNNVHTLTSYDVFGRPTLVKSAASKTEETRTAMDYNDTLRRVITRSDLSGLGDGKLVSIQHYDQLGRVRLTRQLEEASTPSETDEQIGIKVQTRYLYYGSNSYALVSNPYRAATAGGASGEPSMGWTMSQTDNGGRTVAVQTFGGAALPAPWANNSTPTGTVASAYDANFTTVTDQATRVRRSKTNGLGQLVRVDEPGCPTSEPCTPSLGATDNPNQPTSYTYDALSNLTHVYQGSQARNFAYSSLGRLTSATNPEIGLTGNGTINYQYDANGNLTQKTDARSVHSNYTYDALNRNIGVTYTNDPASTPAITRSYDTATSGKGRPASVSSSVGIYTYSGYDALGRVTGGSQTLGSQTYSMSYSYDRASHVTSMTYPSGRTVTNAFDTAGRLSSLSGNLGDGTSRTYSTGISYAAAGQMSQEQFGTDTALYNKLAYNPRQQLSEIRVSTTGGDTSWNRGKIINDYSSQCSGASCNGTDNNGNLLQQTVYVPNNEGNTSSTSWYQQYGYDALNRLSQVHETTGNSALDLQQTFVYDRYGNRTINNNTSMTYGSGVLTMTASVDPSTNRLTAPSGYTMTYDAAGNLTTDNYTGAGDRHYDAENRMYQAWANGQWQTYGYDADGRRVKRIVNGVETWQVYGMGGELLAEYAANTAAAAPQKEYGYRNGQLLVTAAAPTSTRANFALSTNGATASVSSSLGSGFPAGGVINGDRKGTNWGSGGGWADATSGTFPDWVEVDFSGSKTIDEIDVFTLQDSLSSPSEPTETMTFSTYGLSGYDVQYWNGSSWATVTGGSITSNNKVWKKIGFTALATTKIRVSTTAAIDSGYSRMTEVEAWGDNAPPPSAVNVAATANGATASVSSSLGSGFPASGVINGDRKGTNWGSGGGWADSNSGTFPDWVELDFSGSKTINEIDVFTLQDSLSSPSEPTETMTFSTYGVSGFTLFYWDGAAWQPISGGSVTGNNKVWKKISFTALTTTKIKVQCDAAVDNGYSRLTEVEAWGTAAGGGGGSTSSDIEWLVTDQLGTPRMVFDKTGSLANTKRHDYLPFGEELIANQGLRSGTLGYGSDGVRQQFTQKERDNETGLDYFGARYYGSTMGRFTTVDPWTASANTLDPQSINRYSYVGNNPLRYTDPDGMDKSAWDQLTGQEQNLIGGKLVRNTVGKGKHKRKETSKEAFNRILRNNKLDGAQSAANVVAVFRNMLDVTDARTGGAIWNGIKSIDNVFSGNDESGKLNHHMTIQFTTTGGDDAFVRTLQSNGFINNMQVGLWSETTLWGDHRNSARYQTAGAYLVVPHIVQQNNYAAGHFDLHMDPANSACTECSGVEALGAALMHENPNMQLPAIEERKFLQQQRPQTGLKVTTP